MGGVFYYSAQQHIEVWRASTTYERGISQNEICIDPGQPSLKLILNKAGLRNKGNWYVTHPTLPTHPTYLPTHNSPCCCCSSWIIKAISLVSFLLKIYQIEIKSTWTFFFNFSSQIISTQKQIANCLTPLEKKSPPKNISNISLFFFKFIKTIKNSTPCYQNHCPTFVWFFPCFSFFRFYQPKPQKINTKKSF